MELREKLREEGVRPLIKYREFRSIDPRAVRVIDGPRYRQRAMCETVFLTIKRTLGDGVRARTWYGEFRELVLMCAVHNIKQSLNP
jgi:IS5 family transposase